MLQLLALWLWLLRLGLLGLRLLHLLGLWLWLLRLGLLRLGLLRLGLLQLLVLGLLGLLALLLGLSNLLGLGLLQLLTLGLLTLLLWLLAQLTASELTALPACGRLLLVFRRRARQIRGALLLAGLLLAAPSCLSLLSLLAELGLVVLIAHSLSPVAACRFATDGSNDGLDTGKPDSGTPRWAPAVRGSIRRSHWAQRGKSLK